MKRGTLIKQHDIKDCGAACLASVGAYYGNKMPIAKIRQICHTDTRGTNVLGIIQGLEAMGFNAKGVKGDIEALSNIPLPAIAHIIVNGQLHHFVVIYKLSKGKVTVMDPAYGKLEEYSEEDFTKIWTGVLVILEKNEYFEQKDERTSVYARFWNLVKPHKSILFQALLGAVIYTVLGLSTSIYIEKITDYVLIDGNRRLLNLLSIGMIIILLFQIFISSMKSILVLQTGQKMDKHLILGYYKHLLKLPQRFFDTMRVGEIISRVNDAVKIRSFINDVAIQIFVNVFIVFFSFAMMFTYYWKLALIVALVIPFYLLVYWITNKLNKKVERQLMEESADLESHLVESLNSVRTIKQFGIETFANNTTDNKFSVLLKTIYKSVLNALFSGNVIDNIALGEDIPNMQRIIDITKKLGILEFIEKLPNGFQTYLGENGSQLSGGQKQRIAIARALYKNPEVLILDEATSALDTESEQIIQRTLDEFKAQGKTMIVIAHRLSTIAHSDTILVMKEGKVIEQGSHKELLAKDSVYKRMWEKQSVSLS